MSSRAKRVTDPLDEKAKARLVDPMSSYISSGSEYDGGVYGDNESPCLSDLVEGFFEENFSHNHNNVYTDTDESSIVSTSRSSERLGESEVSSSMETIVETVRDDPVKNIILLHVLKAINVFSCLKSNKPMYRRNVMHFLRNVGFNAAICKTKWESSGGLTGGNYEYIDVVASKTTSSSSLNRYIVDLDFDGEFVIARPSENYSRLLATLPRVFVGRGEDLKKIVKVMCDAARRSLKSNDLHFPPWRKNRYMLMKWCGPYRRTINLVATNSTTETRSVVKCRSVGFETDDVNGCFFLDTR